VQGVSGPQTQINATAVTTGTFYPVFVAAAGSNQTASVRTAASAFSYDAATNVLNVTTVQAQYADLAEQFTADAVYEPGTVVVFDGTEEVTIATRVADTKVAGVISAQPSYLMNAYIITKHTATVALQGRVPVKIIGPVRKGDLLVSAANGHAQAMVNPPVGSIIGKSLQNFDGDFGTIEMVVGRD
jgi:hypothetical protein